LPEWLRVKPAGHFFLDSITGQANRGRLENGSCRATLEARSASLLLSAIGQLD
jgi:hypothetical protein